MDDERDDAQGSAGTPSSGWSAPSDPPQHDRVYGAAPHGQAPDGQPAHGQATSEQATSGQTRSGQPAYGQSPYGAPAYGQSPYGAPAYGPPAHGQPTYGPPAYGQSPYGAPTYGQLPYAAGPPARPGTVITAAVLGLVHGALGLLTTAGLLIGGALFDDLVSAVAETDPSLEGGVSSSEVDSVRVGFLLLGLLALAWTVVMVWGSVLALRGRSRVLLIVGSAIAVAVSGFVAVFGLIGLASAPSQDGGTASAVFLLLLFLAALAMLVLICLRSAGQFFAAHRQRRAPSR